MLFKKTSRFFLIISICLISNVSAELFSDEDLIWRSGGNTYFLYDDIDSTKYGKNDHPARLKKEEVTNAIEALSIWDEEYLSSTDALESVFKLESARKMGIYITKGLINAKDNQDIIFRVQSSAPKFLVLKQKYVTTGRAFYRNGKLNIIIGKFKYPVNEALESALDPSGQRKTPSIVLTHGLRDTTHPDFKDIILKLPGIDNKTHKNKIRRDWFVIDVSQASASYIAEKKKKRDPKKARDKQFEIEAAKLAKERREMRLEMARLRKEMKEGGSSSSGQSVEQRLENLDTLHSKGLISDEEYSTKRDEILKDL